MSAWVRTRPHFPGCVSPAGDLGPNQEAELPLGFADSLVQRGLADFISGPGGTVWERDGAGRGGIDPANPFPQTRGFPVQWNVQPPRRVR